MRWFLRLVAVLAWLVAVYGARPSMAAGGDEPGSPIVVGSTAGRTTFEAVIRSDGQGVWVEVRAQQSSPGTAGTQPAPANAPTTSQPVSSGNGQSSSATSTATSTFVRSWTDLNTGIYYSQTGDGTIYSLEPVNIGQASQGPGGWFTTGSQQNPNSTPYAFSVNGNFQSISWIPNNPSSVNWGAPPPAVNTAPPGGNGASTNPVDVALDALGHIPLPNIQLKANPGLGLVAMPSWFWVEGYDGSQFGVSRTVTVPPEVGPEVPITVVPADDPRRQPTSFTVSVRVWPSRYEWYFGDGATLVAQSLGKAYPAESDIQHTYEHSSLPFPSGFPLRLTVDFSAEFSVSTGGGGALPTISRTYEAAYPVQEVQPVLTHP